MFVLLFSFRGIRDSPFAMDVRARERKAGKQQQQTSQQQSNAQPKWRRKKQAIDKREEEEEKNDVENVNNSIFFFWLVATIICVNQLNWWNGLSGSVVELNVRWPLRSLNLRWKKSPCSRRESRHLKTIHFVFQFDKLFSSSKWKKTPKPNNQPGLTNH